MGPTSIHRAAVSEKNTLQLVQQLAGEVRTSGRITFDRFMELALYHPSDGYYSGVEPRIGPEGDYYTSTDVSPLFGATLGRQLHEMWTNMDRPGVFTVLEFGAAKGLLAADILGWVGAAHPDFYETIDYAIVERSASLRAAERATLARLPVRWTDETTLSPGHLTGCVLSNEVADALPFHRVRQLEGRLCELWVVRSTDGFAEEPGEPSTPLLRRYLRSFGVTLAEGQTAEINLRAPGWMSSQVEWLRRGYTLTIDYGDTARALYGRRRPGGTLACYHRHSLNHEPFRQIGSQDITAHVNFTALARAAEEAGAAITGYTTQAYFLAAAGLGEALEWSAQRAATPREFERDRAAVEQLIRPDGLGGFRVLGTHKDVREPNLTGFSLFTEPV